MKAKSSDWINIYYTHKVQPKLIITGYYFIKYQSKDSAKQKAEQIMTLLKQIVEDYITAMNERGE